MRVAVANGRGEKMAVAFVLLDGVVALTLRPIGVPTYLLARNEKFVANTIGLGTKMAVAFLMDGAQNGRCIS